MYHLRCHRCFHILEGLMLGPRNRYINEKKLYYRALTELSCWLMNILMMFFTKTQQKSMEKNGSKSYFIRIWLVVGDHTKSRLTHVWEVSKGIIIAEKTSSLNQAVFCETTPFLEVSWTLLRWFWWSCYDLPNICSISSHSDGLSWWSLLHARSFNLRYFEVLIYHTAVHGIDGMYGGYVVLQCFPK